MKTLRKTARMLAIVALFTLVVFRLISNKVSLKSDLQELVDHQEVVPVKVVLATEQPIEHNLTENGFFRQNHEVDIISETQGNVLKVHVKTGDFVSAGETLISVEKGLLEDQLALAELNLENAKTDLRRFENLVAGDAVTSREYESVKLNYRNALTRMAELKEQLKKTKVTAPFDGFITSRNVGEGSFISPGTPLMGISQLTELLFAVQMTEADVVKISERDKVEIQPSVYSVKPVMGFVREIAVNSLLSGRYEVLIRLSNPHNEIKPGMSGRATFRLSSDREEIVLPRECIIGSILDAKLYLMSGDTVVERKVEASPLNGDRVIVHSGLSTGARVVSSGHINLEQGAKVRMIN